MEEFQFNEFHFLKDFGILLERPNTILESDLDERILDLMGFSDIFKGYFLNNSHRIFNDIFNPEKTYEELFTQFQNRLNEFIPNLRSNIKVQQLLLEYFSIIYLKKKWEIISQICNIAAKLKSLGIESQELDKPFYSNWDKNNIDAMQVFVRISIKQIYFGQVAILKSEIAKEIVNTINTKFNSNMPNIEDNQLRGLVDFLLVQLSKRNKDGTFSIEAFDKDSTKHQLNKLSLDNFIRAIEYLNLQ